MRVSLINERRRGSMEFWTSEVLVKSKLAVVWPVHIDVYHEGGSVLEAGGHTSWMGYITDG